MKISQTFSQNISFRLFILVIATGFITAVCAPQENVNPADLVVLNGHILTVDDHFSEAQAVAIRDGIFVAVGGNSDVEPYIGAGTRVIDADGHTIVPGLFESHNHFTSAVRRELRTGRPFQQLGSIAEIQKYLREQTEQTPEGEWILLPRVDVTRIAEGRIPNSAELDEAAPNHPAVFNWQYADRQIQILNSAALEAAGITANTPVPEGGSIPIGDDGHPTGRLENSGELVNRFLQRETFTEEEYRDGLVRMMNNYHKVGITSIHDAGTNDSDYRTLYSMKENGRLSARVTLTMRMRGLDGTVQGTEEAIRGFNLEYGEGDDRLKVGPLKFRLDGGILYGTAFMREPFGDRALEFYGLDDAEYRGTPFYTPEEVENIIATGHRMGWQMSSHVTGDAGVDRILDAIEAVNARFDEPVQRYKVIHGYFAHEDTAERVARLGAGIDTQPAWYYLDGDALLEPLGEDRVARFMGLQTWLDGGAKVTINSDHMQGFDPNTSLNPYNPFLTMYVAVARRTTGGQVIGPENRVSRENALRMMTIDAAWFDYDENKRGSIEVGKLGDLAILTDNLMSVDEEAIKDILSIVTIVDGDIVYECEDNRLTMQ